MSWIGELLHQCWRCRQFYDGGRGQRYCGYCGAFRDYPLAVAEVVLLSLCVIGLVLFVTIR